MSETSLIPAAAPLPSVPAAPAAPPLPSVPGATGPAKDANPGKAVLTKIKPEPKDGEVAVVPFYLNPEKISVKHQLQTAGLTGQTIDDQIKSLGYISITVGKLLLVGDQVKKYGDTLIAWSYPVDDKGNPLAGGAARSAKLAKAVPIGLRFSWGAEMTFPVSLFHVDINYVRFTAAGRPTRAEVTLTLNQNRIEPLAGTNPTSGGPAGRRARILDSSDRLPTLAAASYGLPAAWRQIARANGVDDPLRMRPGTAVFLPEAGEMAAEAAARRANGNGSSNGTWNGGGAVRG